MPDGLNPLSSNNLCGRQEKRNEDETSEIEELEKGKFWQRAFLDPKCSGHYQLETQICHKETSTAMALHELLARGSTRTGSRLAPDITYLRRGLEFVPCLQMVTDFAFAQNQSAEGPLPEF